MRRILIAAALTLAAVPAWAQTASDKMAAARCGSPHPEMAIAGCSALIQTPKQTDAMLIFAYNDRAWAYLTVGKSHEALRDVNMALLLAPKNAAVVETRAEIYEKLKERDKAIADYREALKLDPKMKEASAGLKRLGATP